MDYEPFSRNGLILAGDVLPFLRSHRELRRDIENGTLVRVRRGAYTTSELWHSLEPQARHLLRIRAVAAHARDRPVFAGHSAAVLWGMPLWSVPDDVLLLDRWKGGGRSEPGVRRTAVGASRAQTVERDGLVCTDLARTALQLARVLPFGQAIGCLDWALWRRNPLAISRQALAEDLKRLGSPLRLVRAVAFATELSGSLGESDARAVIHQLGFLSPELQMRFLDEEGEMYPDFYWRVCDVAAEFDGKVKYTRNEYTGGDPAAVLWREKRREDRLRRQVKTVVRITTADVREPSRLSNMLLAAGVPRRSAGERGARREL